MGKFKKIDWVKLDADMRKAILQNNDDERPHLRIQEAMDNFPCWRFYTDAELGLCVFRILGVYPPPDVDTNPDFIIRLVAASLPPGRNEDLRLDLLPLDYFKMVDEWNPHHVSMIRGHKHGEAFINPVGFMWIQQNLDQMTLDTYESKDDDVSIV